MSVLSRLRLIGSSLLLAAAPLPPATAGESIEALLQSVWAEPLAGPAAATAGFIDFAALYATTGFDRNARSAAETLDAGDAQNDAFEDALLRIHTSASFLPYLSQGGGQWRDWLGFDMLALDWAMALGEPPRQLLYLGLPTAPHAAAIQAALAARGLTATEAGGITLFQRGKDGGISPQDRLPGYPFWGELGSSERLALLPQALLGSRFAATTLAAATGPRLADDAVLAAGLRAVDDAALPGRLLQLTLARDDFSPDYIKALLAPGTALDEAKAALEAQAPGPLPAFRLLVLADRQGEAGEETLVALVYDSAADAAVAAETLPARLAVYQPQRADRPLQALLGVTVLASVGAVDGLSVVLLRLLPDPALAAPGRKPGQSYRQLLQGLYTRDLAWLTWK